MIHFPRDNTQALGARALAKPIQLPLCPDQATLTLTRIQPDCNQLHLYRVAVRPGLFGQHLERVGMPGHRRLDPYPNAGAAVDALTQLVRAKRRCGYRNGPT